MGQITCSVADACKATGLGRTKIYALISEGCLESTTIGRRRLVDVASLQRLLRPRWSIAALLIGGATWATRGTSGWIYRLVSRKIRGNSVFYRGSELPPAPPKPAVLADGERLTGCVP